MTAFPGAMILAGGRVFRTLSTLRWVKWMTSLPRGSMQTALLAHTIVDFRDNCVNQSKHGLPSGGWTFHRHCDCWMYHPRALDMARMNGSSTALPAQIHPCIQTPANNVRNTVGQYSPAFVGWMR